MMYLPPFFKKETTIAGMLIAIILLLSLTPDIIKWIQTPAERVYQPIHNNLIDYALYISYERQGLEGLSVQYDRFTTETHPGKLVNPFYLFIGRIWRLTGIQNPHVVYHMMRIILGLAWALIVYWYIRRSIQSKIGRIAALFFVLYGASFPVIHWSDKGLTVSYFMEWWSELDPIDRATFLPAHLMGHILLLTTIALFTAKDMFVKIYRLKIPTAIVGTMTGFFAGLFHTPSLILPSLLLPLFMLFSKQWKRLLILFLCLGVSALSFLILSEQFRTIPWIAYWKHEQTAFAVSYLEYLLALGPVVPLALLGVFIGTFQHHRKLLFTLWMGIGLLCVPLAPILFQGSLPFLNTLPLSNLRFLQMSLVVPLSILAGSALVRIQQIWGGRVLFFVSLLLFSITIIGYPSSLVMHIQNEFGGALFQYPTKSWKNAIKSLEQKDETKAVLSLPFAGCAIAMDTNRTVYVGRVYSTINLDEKTDLAFQFYQGTMPLCQAYAFLSDNRITDVFYGYDEQKAGNGFTAYPFVTLTSDFTDTQIYRFTGEKPMECP